MSLVNVEQIEQQDAHEQKWYQKFSGRYVAPTLATAGLLMTGSAHAEGSVAETMTAAITAEINGLTGTQKVIYGLMILVLVGFVAWRYTKRTVSSA